MNTATLIVKQIDSEIEKLAFILSGDTQPYDRKDIEKVRDLYVEMRGVYEKYTNK